MERMQLSLADYRVMLAHCYDGLPDEACGLLGGTRGSGPDFVPTGEIGGVYPCENAAHSSRIYQIGGRDYMAAERSAGLAGLDIVGAWHSHTHTDAYPSPTDVEQAMGVQSLNGTWLFPIMSLKFSEPVLRVYRIDAISGRISEIPVEVEA
jgi:proteasome lid subunit RPN8/RPN11